MQTLCVQEIPAGSRNQVSDVYVVIYVRPPALRVNLTASDKPRRHILQNFPSTCKTTEAAPSDEYLCAQCMHVQKFIYSQDVP